MKNLEDELKELKSRQRDLEHELGDGRLRAPQPKPKPAVDPPPELSDNALVRSHIDSLNNNIGKQFGHVILHNSKNNFYSIIQIVKACSAISIFYFRL